MLFNSPQFLLFFATVVTAYFILPHRMRWGFLLAASYYFYLCWNPRYIFLILLSTTTSYLCATVMEPGSPAVRRKMALVASLSLNLGVLFFFKYFNFFSRSLEHLLSRTSISFPAPELQVLLPIGISFYTFQALSYSIDVYRGARAPERHFGIFALYVAFFPQLVAGPIERSTRLLPQFRRRVHFDYARVTEGLKLMGWGLFKKVVIADRLATVVDHVYGNPQGFNGLSLAVATVCFGFQIYCDFSGYSDIAIGAARVLGFNLMTNFRRPYFSSSLSDFWRRWHISLSTWFRDYLYIPLGGSRVGKAREYWNFMVVFLISGLWHGASWTFVMWGGLHGALLVVERSTSGIRKGAARRLGLDRYPRILKGFGHLVTFSTVTFAWIFFRANNIGDALFIVGRIFSDAAASFPPAGVFEGFHARDFLQDRTLGMTVTGLLATGSFIVLMETVQLLQERGVAIATWVSRQAFLVRWSLYYGLVVTVLRFGVFGKHEFIYFQF